MAKLETASPAYATLRSRCPADIVFRSVATVIYALWPHGGSVQKFCENFVQNFVASGQNLA